MKLIEVNSFKAFEKLYDDYEAQKSQLASELQGLIFLFVAGSDPLTDQSWCSDCRQSKPIIDKTLDEYKFNEQLSVAIVNVGNRDEWKSSDNPFRNHKIGLTAVPTLLSLKTGIRLVEDECKDIAKVSHLFSNTL